MQHSDKHHWVTVWTASAQGAYPVGSAIAQPHLEMAIPQPQKGLVNQSFRMIFKPALWSSKIRLRISNVFGKQTLQLRDLKVGFHLGGGALVPETCVDILDMDIAAGKTQWTQPIELSKTATHQAAHLPNNALVLSAWVAGESGPITWHAKAMASSYLSMPNMRVSQQDSSEFKFPFSTTSMFFLDAADAFLAENCHAVAAFGDSLTDGTFTTLNGFDRWTDVLQRSLWLAGQHNTAVLNAGIGGNQVISPLSTQAPWRGGPAAIERLERDVLSLSGIRTLIWLEGINDFSENGNAEVEDLKSALSLAVQRIRSEGIRVMGVTLPSAFKSTRQGHGSHLQDTKRKSFNQFLLSSDLFDAVVDIDKVLTNPNSGCLDPLFDFDSTLGEPGDGIHPNRAGHAAIANEIFRALNG